MAKRMLVVGISAIFLLGVLILIFLSGFSYYFKAYWAISRLGGAEKIASEDQFYGKNLVNTVRGTFAGALTYSGDPKVLVWSRGVLRVLPTDNLTLYVFSDACNEKSINATSNDDVSIKTNKYLSIQDWIQKIRPGDYVSVILTDSEMGGTVGNAREIYAYNWWYFLPRSLKDQCAK